MPIIKASIKHQRQSEKRRIVNRIIKERVKENVKVMIKLAKNKQFDEMAKRLPETFKIIDKAAKNNILHKNTAARKKSRLSRLLSKAK